MNTFALLAVYCCLIAFVSLAGGRLTSLIRMTHLRTQLLMSGVGGLMLGIALLHLLPHATEILGSPSRAGTGALLGLTAMFLLIRLFHTHDHAVPVVDDSGEGASCDGDGSDRSHGDSGRGHAPVCDHHHHHGVKGISWVGLFFGLLLHTLVDGIALSASVIAEADHGAWLGLAGLGTFLAVALHKPLDAFAITSVMNRQRWSVAAQWAANSVFSLACPVGAIAFYFGVSGLVDHSDLLGWGLAVSAGFFIGIALADLLPEVAFHDHDRGKLTLVFLLGIVVAFAIENLPGHSHDHGHSHGHESRADTHDHGEHDPSHADGHSH
ncbi:ZIP family metal transporter [Crateriforma conspicua]|uniref:Zinc transporter ZupT n=1 Tax=Crateriforma conspicua TaxID=2527996 RepID=A0A5C5Y619_9PLAN|nr:ZIP family metal transporter [Crateriforma conspicua]QDV65167.1 zinc transporter ZupT [Crateriforma conspicua]TWT70564.1 zinc transporter ZupT [Crateriforma conspicua]